MQGKNELTMADIPPHDDRYVMNRNQVQNWTDVNGEVHILITL